MPRPKKVATENPVHRAPTAPSGPKELDPNLHYVKVQKDGKFGKSEWESRIPEYLDMPSLTKPGQKMYHVASRDRTLTGSSKMELLACSKEDYEARRKLLDDIALEKQTAVQPGETFQQKGVLRLTEDFKNEDSAEIASIGLPE